MVLGIFDPSFHHKRADLFAQGHKNDYHAKDNHKAQRVNGQQNGGNRKKRNDMTHVNSYKHHKILNVS